MAHFAEAFWSSDYAGGLGVLFSKLQQGVQENQQLLTIARMRADAEESYGSHIGDIGPATDRIADGFARDEGGSVRKAYDGVRSEMLEAASKHRKIAQNIRELVVYPFGRWCDQHAARVQNSQDDLQNRVKAHERQADYVRKLRSQYFNKCRLVEDIEEEDKLAFKDPTAETASPKQQPPAVRIQEPDEFDEPQQFEIGDNVFQFEQMKSILTHMLDNMPLGETKVPILGVYQNTTTGADIVAYIQKFLNGTTVSYAERIGQDLIENGFLRLIGNVGNTFANSSRMKYQWRPKVFKITGYPEKRSMSRSTTMSTIDGVESPIFGNIQEYMQGLNPLNNPHPNETPAQKLQREAKESDERYKAGVRKLDTLRCTLEEAMIDHLKFMERCELDRLKAVKAVILDFSGAISNVIPSLQNSVDKMMLFQETIQPAQDLRYLLESYRVGPFVPKVQPYENYYNSVDEVTFGVDLEARARSDKKRVPQIVTAILTFLDNQYPLLDGDEARRAIWTVEVPLAASHHLRHELNTGKEPVAQETLAKYEVPIVASVLKLYLLELPDPLVSSSLFEIIRTIYSSSSSSNSESDTATRVSVLQNTLTQLRLTNIATLEAVCTHFARLLDLTNADDAYITQLTQTIAPCILRPKASSASIVFEDKSNVRFVRDLFANKTAIFSDLKRSSALHHSASVARAASTAAPPPGYPVLRAPDNSPARARAPSTDESNRRAHMEERNRAIASRSRGSSPAPGARLSDPNARLSDTNTGPGTPGLSAPAQRHRRDSSRGAETRFPVHVPSASRDLRGTGAPQPKRSSLTVPGDAAGNTGATGATGSPASMSASTATTTQDSSASRESVNGTSASAIATASAGANTTSRHRQDRSTSNPSVSPPSTRQSDMPLTSATLMPSHSPSNSNEAAITTSTTASPKANVGRTGSGRSTSDSVAKRTSAADDGIVSSSLTSVGDFSEPYMYAGGDDDDEFEDAEESRGSGAAAGDRQRVRLQDRAMSFD